MAKIAIVKMCKKCPHYSDNPVFVQYCIELNKRIPNRELIAIDCPLPDYYERAVTGKVEGEQNDD